MAMFNHQGRWFRSGPARVLDTNLERSNIAWPGLVTKKAETLLLLTWLPFPPEALRGGGEKCAEWVPAYRLFLVKNGNSGATGPHRLGGTNVTLLGTRVTRRDRGAEDTTPQHPVVGVERTSEGGT